jgi:hypothetical protein
VRLEDTREISRKRRKIERRANANAGFLRAARTCDARPRRRRARVDAVTSSSLSFSLFRSSLFLASAFVTRAFVTLERRLIDLTAVSVAEVVSR